MKRVLLCLVALILAPSTTTHAQSDDQAYCTELSAPALSLALAAADAAQAPGRRDAILKTLMSRQTPPSHEDVVAANRAMTAAT